MKHTHLYLQISIVLGATAAVSAVSAQSRRLESSPEPTVISPQTQAVPTEDSEDVDFVLDALRSGKAEVRLGELAQQRAGSAEVRAYGEKLEADHSQSVQEITALVEPLNMTVPTEPSPEDEVHYAALAKLSGQEFDAAFVPHMIQSHREAIEKYGAQTHANPNKELSDVASKALPMLREHLAIAESLQKSLGGR